MLQNSIVQYLFNIFLQSDKKDEVQRKTSRDKGKAPPPPPLQAGADKEKRPAPQPPPIPPMPGVGQNETNTPPPTPTKPVTPSSSPKIETTPDIPLPQAENIYRNTDSPDNEKLMNVRDIKKALECQLSKRSV